MIQENNSSMNILISKSGERNFKPKKPNDYHPL